MEQTQKKTKRLNSTKRAIIGALVGVFALLNAPFAMAIGTQVYPDFSNVTGTPSTTVRTNIMLVNSSFMTELTTNSGDACSTLISRGTIESPITIAGSNTSSSGPCSNILNTGYNEHFSIGTLSYQTGYIPVTDNYFYKLTDTTTGDYVYTVFYWNAETNTGTYTPSYTDGFNIIVKKQDGTEITNGGNLTDTTGGIYTVNVNVNGTNSAGVFNNFHFILSDNGVAVTLPIEIPSLTDYPISINAVNYDYINFNLSDLHTIWQVGHTYTLTFEMQSDFSDTITHNFEFYYGTAPTEINYETCETVDIACYIRNAFRWAFTVPQETFTQFQTLKNDIATKAPFGYITSVFNLLGNLNNTTAQAFTLEEVTPINNLIFSPIRTGLEWILYFVFTFMLFKRFRDLII